MVLPMANTTDRHFLQQTWCADEWKCSDYRRTNIARVAQAATTTIPIIFATANDPVQDGLVKSINRPGGNSTGAFVLNTALLPKRFELLRQLLPNARLVGFLVNPNGATTADQIRYAQSAGRIMALELLVLNAATSTEIDAAFGSLVQHGVDGLVMGNDPFFQVRQDQLIALAARHRIPTIYEWSEFVRAGGLAAYSTDRVEMFRQMGIYVSRILNGAKPADLPIMQPTKFELVINAKTPGLRIETDGIAATTRRRGDRITHAKCCGA